MPGQSKQHKNQADQIDLPPQAHDKLELLVAHRTADLTQAVESLQAEVQDRNRAEKALRESEEKFRMLAENISGMIYMCANDERYTLHFVSDAIEHLTGYPKKEFLEDRICYAELIHPEDIGLVEAGVNKAVACRESYHLIYRIHHQKGHWVWVEEWGAGIFREDELAFLEGYVSDITAHKNTEQQLRQAHEELEQRVKLRTQELARVNEQLSSEIADRQQVEMALRDSEQTLKQYFEAMPVGIFVTRPDGAVYYVNRQGQELLGKGAVENVDAGHLSEVYQVYIEGTDQLYPTEELPVVRALAGETSQVEDIMIRHPDRDIPIEVWSSPVLDRQGDIQYALAAFVDITDRRDAERALHESEQGLRAMFDAAPIGVARVDDQGNLIRVNQAFIDLFGFTEEELLESTFMQLTHPDDMGKSMHLMRSLRSGECNRFFMEKRYIRKDGSTLWATLAVAAVRSSNNKLLHTVSMVQDITDRRLAQEKMAANELRLQEMDLELTLAEERERRRIAADLHDHIGQTLSLAQIKIESLRPSLDSEPSRDTLRQSVDLIRQTVEVSRTLMFDLSPPVLYDFGFEAAMEWLIEQYQGHKGIKIHLINDNSKKPLAEAVSVLLFRSLRELLINITKYAKADHAQITLRTEQQRLFVEVKDDGVGFDVKTLSFDSGAKHGYGLFSVRERLDRIGGHCEIESTPGKGTRVIMDVALLAQTPD